MWVIIVTDGNEELRENLALWYCRDAIAAAIRSRQTLTGTGESRG